jgi:hypothetical protein
MKYRKKPVVVEAIQYNGTNLDELEKFVGKALEYSIYAKFEDLEAYLVQLTTLEGKMEVRKGDYIIRGIEGEFYPCKPDIFEKTYEMVGDDK